jgi:hypothetical protein
MAVFDAPADDDSGELRCLADCRAAAERLRRETAAEVGVAPMPPEKLAMIATMLASLPLAGLMLAPVPVEVHGWQVGLALLLVWAGVFRLQSLRYARFQALWQRSFAAHVRAGIGDPGRDRG